MTTITTMSHIAMSQTRNKLDLYARWGLWALLAWAALLVYGMLTHQPDPTTDFAGYASYITTTEFLISHLVASIFGAAVGTLGLTALFVVLCKGRAAPLALWALVTGIIGNTLVTSVFGVAAFAQPTIGRAYLAGHMAEAVAINSDVYGPALFATALAGLLLLTIGIVLFGVAVVCSGSLPKLAGIGFALGGAAFTVLGILFSNSLQPLGAVVMAASAVWIAITGWRMARP